MALVSMKKVRLIGLLDQREAMLRQLQRMDVVELREIPADDDLSRLGIGPMPVSYTHLVLYRQTEAGRYGRSC